MLIAVQFLNLDFPAVQSYYVILESSILLLFRGIIRIVQVVFRSESGLTHKLTHWAKFAGGNSGVDGRNELLISDGKGLKRLGNGRISMPRAICNQQVGGSNPSTSSRN